MLFRNWASFFLLFITTQAVGQFKVLHLHDSIYSPAVVSQYSYYYLDDTESLTIDGLINKDYSLIFEQKKSLKVRANLFYGIYVFFVAVFFMTQTGHIYQYLIPNYTQLNNSLPLNGACLSMLFIALFAMDFLELKVNAKTWYYVYVAICAMLLVNLLLQFIDYRLANMLSLYLSGIIFMILLVSSIVLWKKNVPMAGYLIPGWTLYTFGVIIHAMRNLGMVPSHFISDYSLFIATVLEVLVLTVAISINQRKIVLSSIKAKQRSKIRQLKLENERMRAQQLLMENDAINRQLLSVSMESKQQDDLLSSLKNVESEDQLRQKINKLLVKRSVQSNYWENFKTIFETVHPDFFTNIKSVYPQLSSNDLRQLAYAKMHLQVKEIAMLTGVSTQAVKMARNRLKKKIGTNNPLSDFVNHL